MTQYTCGNFTVTMLHYGNKKVFLRDNAGEEFTVQRDFFDEKYEKGREFECPKGYDCPANCLSSSCGAYSQ